MNPPVDTAVETRLSPGSVLNPVTALADNKLPTNQLQEIVEQVESENELHQRMNRALEGYERRYQSLVENIPDLVYSLNENGIILTVNQAVRTYGYTCDELIGHSFADLIYYKDRSRIANAYFEIVAQHKNYAHTQQFRAVTKTGEIRWFEANSSIRFTPEGQFILQEGVCRDITERIQVQNTLLKAQDDLEEQVRKRTSELTKANLDLQKEILERREAEKVLREREKDLEMEKANLQEVNIALKVLLKRREVDKRALEEQVMHNVKKLLLPYLHKIQKDTTDERHKAYLNIIETNLQDITCAFSRRLSIDFYGLTTSELKVANFIRQGKKSREIADVLGLSIRTVEAFRMSIRHKLRIQNKNVNLRTLLMSIS